MRFLCYRPTVGCVLAWILVVGAGQALAQVNPRDVPVVAQPQQRFDSGQDIQPIFEGWRRNDDSSFMLHFGYLNRNYREQPNLPVGQGNYFLPGDEDRGQPTYFYPRTHHFQFEVWAPSTMGTSFDDALVWTVVHNGSEQKAYGWLQPEWEIDEHTITSNQGMGRGHTLEVLQRNQPPTVTVDASQRTVGIGRLVTLSASIADDELPPVLPVRARREPLPALKRPDDLPAIPDNIKSYRRPRPPRNGLSLLWVVYRGPADAAFEPSSYQRALAEAGDEGAPSGRLGNTESAPSEATSLEGDGLTSARFKAVVTFAEPGTYTLRAWATDSMHKTPGDVTITVTN